MEKEKRLALNLATMNTKALLPKGHDIINRHVKALLTEGYITYGSGNRAYKLTAKGKAAL